MVRRSATGEGGTLTCRTPEDMRRAACGTGRRNASRTSPFMTTPGMLALLEERTNISRDITPVDASATLSD
jgi:hypothetical protein